MRAIKDTAGTMMISAQVPHFLWAEVVACAVYIHNRVLNNQGCGVTAFKALFGTTPT